MDYLQVKYKFGGKDITKQFTIDEMTNTSVPLGAMVLSDDNKCEVELIECTEETYKSFFGEIN